MRKISMILSGLATILALNTSPAIAKDKIIDGKPKFSNPKRDWDEFDYRSWHVRGGFQLSSSDKGLATSKKTWEEDKFRIDYTLGAVYQFDSGARLGGATLLGALRNTYSELVNSPASPNGRRWEKKSELKGIKGVGILNGVNIFAGQDLRFLTIDTGAGIRRGYQGFTPYGVVDVMSDFGIETLECLGTKVGLGTEFSSDGKLFYITFSIGKEWGK